MHRQSLFAAALILCLAPTLPAQRDKEPKRPKLAAGADTNNANAYYQFAIDQLRKEPDAAADALYWSTRIDPTFADGFYARRIALLLADRNRLIRYWDGDRRTIQSADIRRIDSLYLQALTINPFVSQSLDREIFEGVADELSKRYSHSGDGDPLTIRYAIDRQMMQAPLATKAWLAYGAGRFEEALMLYAQAIKDDKRNGPLRVDRGRLFYQMGTVDSALTELNLAIEDLRKRDKKELIFVYQSKAVTEHSIGIAHKRLGHVDEAKEAFGRALQEDLAYAPAHMQLAYMALDVKDTATALAEMDLAVQVRGDDPATRYVYGYTLATNGRRDEAEIQLRKAIELDRWYALPYFVLGFLDEAKNKGADAARDFGMFVSLATADDPRRERAKERLETLNAIMKP